MLIAFVLVGAIMVTGCSGGGLKKPTIAVNLPEKYNTPDGMVLGADNYIYLNIPNFNDHNYPAKVIKISPSDQISEVCTLPVHPETGRSGPLGIDIGLDGHLYIADNQSMCGFNDHQSRLIRVLMKDGKAVGSEVLVTGFIQSNAVSCYGDSVYVTETSLDLEADPMPSGVYRFKYSEFKGEPIKLQPGTGDKHLLASFTTSNPDWRVGANGMGFDSKGNLYVCNFGEASIIKMKLDESGKVVSQKVFVKGQGMESTDGIKFDPKTDDIYVADFVGDAVHKVSNKGKVTTIAKNEVNSGGVGGKLDKPSEVCLRGKRVYVANIDLPFGGNEYDAAHTISVIELDK
jgi:sugar lactone lactonase YvrE